MLSATADFEAARAAYKAASEAAYLSHHAVVAVDVISGLDVGVLRTDPPPPRSGKKF